MTTLNSNIDLDNKLVDLVRANPMLYEKELRSTPYDSMKKKTEMWKGIATSLGLDSVRYVFLSATIPNHANSRSPSLSFPLPYLETEQGRKCTSLFPAELYFSKQWSSANAANNNNNNERNENMEPAQIISATTPQLNAPHPFLKLKITAPIDNREIQTLLAEFRAFGGRYPKKKKMLKLSKCSESYQKSQKISEDHMYKDALDLENHQRLPVLFWSFYFNPKAACSFSRYCIMRWKNLRDKFRRELSKLHEIQDKCAVKKMCTWPLFEKMRFLESHIRYHSLHREKNFAPHISINWSEVDAEQLVEEVEDDDPDDPLQEEMDAETTFVSEKAKATVTNLSILNSNAPLNMKRIEALLDGFDEMSRVKAEKRVVAYLCKCQLKSLNNEDIDEVVI